MFAGKTLRLDALNDGLIELRFDRAGESVNKFDRTTLDELRQAVQLIVGVSSKSNGKDRGACRCRV